jgi:hypothetical protein
MPRADQRGHHLRQTFTRGNIAHLIDVATVLVAQFRPCFDECCAIAGHAVEVPIEAALGDAELVAQPVDLQRLHAFRGQDRVTGLDPVIHRQSVASGAARTRHERQPTAVAVVSADGNVTIPLGRQSSAEGLSGYLASCFTATYN